MKMLMLCKECGDVNGHYGFCSQYKAPNPPDETRHSDYCISAYYNDGGQGGCICGAEEKADENR